MEITIFLASSSELADDRAAFMEFITELNNDWEPRDICFKLRHWESFIDSMSKEGLQKEYNKAVRECDIFLMLFFTKVGKYTGEEFETAFQQFEINNKPRIYTFFKESYILTGQIGEEIISMLEFKKKLSELKHYCSSYSSIDNLKWKFSRQLEKLYGDKFSMDYDINSLKNPIQIDSEVIDRVCKFISPNADEKILENSKLPELIKRSSEFGKNAVFQLAKVNRRTNRSINRNLMARSIPIFQALIDASPRQDEHRYFGQLAYAIKDQEKSDFKTAEDLLNKAIMIRGDYDIEYFYEFNRAVCKVHNESNPDKDLIVRDLKYAKPAIINQVDELFREMDNRRLKNWLLENNLNIQEL